MEFKTGINVGGIFVSDEELEELQQKKSALLYFLRKDEYKLFYDFPCMGGMGRLLSSSFIEGPFDLKPNVKEGTEYDNYLEEVVTRIIPVDGVPDKFEEVELVRYGINEDPSFVDFLNTTSNLNWNKIKEIGDATFKALDEISDGLERIDDSNGMGSVYKTFLEGVRVDLVCDYGNLEKRMYYPKVVLIMFGKHYDHCKFIERLELGKLNDIGEGEVFRSYHDREFGFEYSIRCGLVYNLEIGRDLDLSKLDEMENVIL